MFCPECGAENKSSAKFCEQCGLTLRPKISLPTSGKPLGIVVIVILSVLSGVAQMALGGIFAFIPQFIGLSAAAMGQAIDTSVHIASLKIAGVAIALFISGILTVAAAYGLWSFLGWGRVLAIILYSIGLLAGVIAFFISFNTTQSAGAIVLQIFGFGQGIWILAYLFKPNIRDLFHGAGISRPTALYI